MTEKSVEFADRTKLARYVASLRQLGIHLRSSIVPLIHQRSKACTNACAIGRVPSHLGKATDLEGMVQDWEGLGRLYTDTFIAARVSVDFGATEGSICLPVCLVQCMSGAEPIYER
jgi:hypothetical protein